MDGPDFFDLNRAWGSAAFGADHVLAEDTSRYILLPGTPHAGPYEQEVRRAVAEHGLIQTDVMSASDMRGRNFIHRGYALLPGDNAPLGDSPDGSGVPVIPGELYPMQDSISVFFNGELWSPIDSQGEGIFDLSHEGIVVDEHGAERDFTGLGWSHQLQIGALGHLPNTPASKLVGEWEHHETVLDASGENGWEIVYRWEVVNRRSRVDGDLSHNNELDLHDLNILIQNVAVDASNLKLDLNNDDAVNFDDVQHWVTDLKSTWIGDANLDGEFNSRDFVDAFQAGKYETDDLAHWSEGDWNADERFNSSDFVAAFQDGGYEVGPKAAVATVPEPSCWILLTLGLTGIGHIRRRR